MVVQRGGSQRSGIGRFSIDSHFTRNALLGARNHPEKADQPTGLRQKIISRYRLPSA